MTIYHPAQEKNRFHRSLFFIFMGSAVLLIAVGALLFIKLNHNSNNPEAKDSGVVGCTQMAERAKGKVKTTTNFAAVRKQFSDSVYEDLKTAGVSLVNSLENVKNLAADPNSDATLGLASYVQMQKDWTTMQAACLNHGVTVPALPSN